jgi:hypothetical protein
MNPLTCNIPIELLELQGKKIVVEPAGALMTERNGPAVPSLTLEPYQDLII